MTGRDVIRVVLERLLADMKAADAYSDPRARRIAIATLESFRNNLAVELRARGADVNTLDDLAELDGVAATDLPAKASAP